MTTLNCLRAHAVDALEMARELPMTEQNKALLWQIMYINSALSLLQKIDENGVRQNGLLKVEFDPYYTSEAYFKEWCKTGGWDPQVMACM